FGLRESVWGGPPSRQTPGLAASSGEVYETRPGFKTGHLPQPPESLQAGCTMSSQSISKVLQHAEATNRRLARIKQEAKLNEARAIGSVVGIGAAALAGYVDGAFDLSESDRGHGDGFQVFGLPATPIAGVGLLVLGMSDLVPGAQYVAAAGLGITSGWAYGQG